MIPLNEKFGNDTHASFTYNFAFGCARVYIYLFFKLHVVTYCNDMRNQRRRTNCAINQKYLNNINDRKREGIQSMDQGKKRIQCVRNNKLKN